jgi:hypothetical protein
MSGQMGFYIFLHVYGHREIATSGQMGFKHVFKCLDTGNLLWAVKWLFKYLYMCIESEKLYRLAELHQAFLCLLSSDQMNKILKLFNMHYKTF